MNRRMPAREAQKVRAQLRRKTALKSACVTGKRRYRDQASAELMLARITVQDDPRRAKLPQRAYECPNCAGWHLTSMRSIPPSRTPLPTASPKRIKEQRQRTAMLKAKYGDERPTCAVPGCWQWADDAHEPLSRARGGSITDPENVVAICRAHHDQLTFAPETTLDWAYELNLLRHSWPGEAS